MNRERLPKVPEAQALRSRVEVSYKKKVGPPILLAVIHGALHVCRPQWSSSEVVEDELVDQCQENDGRHQSIESVEVDQRKAAQVASRCRRVKSWHDRVRDQEPREEEESIH